jgi:Xaa-Pro aminopeptidase
MVLFRLMLLLAPVLVPQDEFRERRDRLRAAIPNAAAVLYGAGDQDHADLRSGFIQEPNFYYLTGWNQPGAALLLLPENFEPREILFLPARDERIERYSGHRAAPGDNGLARLTGFTNILPIDALDAELARRREQIGQWRTLKAHSARLQKAINQEPGDAAPEITALRVRKSPRELARLQQSIDATVEAHLAAWRRAKPGLHEYQLAATLTGSFLDQGCPRNAYPPIVGSGPNGVILHYQANGRRVDDGELVLIDSGAECGYYAADLTRTIPVNGKFTARQKQLYQAVLGAQKAAIAAVKPGVNMQDLTRIAREYLDSHGNLGKYFTHGIGHHIGLLVHDPGPLNDLQPGMVVTIEPGVYLPEEGIGIRIEDMVLVTESGARVLSSALPKDPGEIEKRMAK